jgi:DNA-binding HxlR family transcriptional regulator
VECSLTDFGKTCIPLLDAIVKWGNQIALEKAAFVNEN